MGQRGGCCRLSKRAGIWSPVVRMHVAQAEGETDPKRKDQLLDQAIAKVTNDI